MFKRLTHTGRGSRNALAITGTDLTAALAENNQGGQGQKDDDGEEAQGKETEPKRAKKRKQPVGDETYPNSKASKPDKREAPATYGLLLPSVSYLCPLLSLLTSPPDRVSSSPVVAPGLLFCRSYSISCS